MSLLISNQHAGEGFVSVAYVILGTLSQFALEYALISLVFYAAVDDSYIRFFDLCHVFLVQHPYVFFQVVKVFIEQTTIVTYIRRFKFDLTTRDVVDYVLLKDKRYVQFLTEAVVDVVFQTYRIAFRLLYGVFHIHPGVLI